MKGKLITIEGSDGAGKTTQISMLEVYLLQNGYDIMLTREPGGTAIGEKIREILLDTDNEDMSPVTEALLYAASRAQHVRDKIKPALAEGKLIICDRFLDSSIAYQGFGRNLGLSAVEQINQQAVDGLVPDITFYLDIPPQVGIARKKGAQELDRMELEKLDFHEKVYGGFQEIAKKYSGRVFKINADRPPREVHTEIVGLLQNIL